MNNAENMEYLTLPEVVKMLKVHPNTLRNWDNDGTLPAVRIGKRKIRRWKKSDVIKFIEASK
ncbi:MAG TPA: helix-turn-helix domain-containing protein [Candidatus Saccharimonadales bacterium]|nr:helix-turn-helix domain-containing protein [Candidatus Saccharimonadales bacterium]